MTTDRLLLNVITRNTTHGLDAIELDQCLQRLISLLEADERIRIVCKLEDLVQAQIDMMQEIVDMMKEIAIKEEKSN